MQFKFKWFDTPTGALVCVSLSHSARNKVFRRSRMPQYGIEYFVVYAEASRAEADFRESDRLRIEAEVIALCPSSGRSPLLYGRKGVAIILSMH